MIRANKLLARKIPGCLSQSVRVKICEFHSLFWLSSLHIAHCEDGLDNNFWSSEIIPTSPSYYLLFIFSSNANVLELRKRYTNLYIPSDFFLAGCSYQEAFPLGRPFNTAHPCNYHMMSKDVEPVAKNSAVLEPPDVSYLFSAKVGVLQKDYKSSPSL